MKRFRILLTVVVMVITMADSIQAQFSPDAGPDILIFRETVVDYTATTVSDSMMIYYSTIGLTPEADRRMILVKI